jgi:hypothetical protein
MKINLVYNDFQRIVEIDESKKIGSVLENILSICSLMIYNIENCQININNSQYVLGSDDMPFNIKLVDFIADKEFDKNSQENKMVLHDRKRDELGNVIKNNYIIERYNKWFINNENENYFHSFMNQPSIHETAPSNILFQNIISRNIISSNILSEVMNIQNRSIRQRLYPNNEEDLGETSTDETALRETSSIENTTSIIEGEETKEDEHEETKEDEETINESNNRSSNLSFSWDSPEGQSILSFNWDNNIEQTYYNLIHYNSQQENNENENENEEGVQEDNEEENNEEENEENTNENTNENTLIYEGESGITGGIISNESQVNRQSVNLNRVINIFDRYIRNFPINNSDNIDNNIITMNNFMQFSNLMTDEYADMPPLIALDDFEFQVPVANRFVDVKVVLTEEEFNSLETNEYSYFHYSSKICDCLICMNEFKSDDIVLKTCDEHIFHKDCIQSWLCKESNKCPICRNDIGNSKTTI